MDIEPLGSDNITGLDEASDENQENVLIVSNDGYICNIRKTYTCISTFLKGMYEGDSEAGKLGTEIHLSKLSGNALRLIEEYMNHHKGDDIDIPNMPLEDTNMRSILKDSWDADFLDRICPMISSTNDTDEEIPQLTNLIELGIGLKYNLGNIISRKVRRKIKRKLKKKYRRS